jgi:hypothetical protein
VGVRADPKAHRGDCLRNARDGASRGQSSCGARLSRRERPPSLPRTAATMRTLRWRRSQMKPAPLLAAAAAPPARARHARGHRLPGRSLGARRGPSTSAGEPSIDSTAPDIHSVHGPRQVPDLWLAGERQVDAAPSIASQGGLKPQHGSDATGRRGGAVTHADLNLLVEGILDRLPVAGDPGRRRRTSAAGSTEKRPLLATA